jgi:hypothetical protein
MTHRVRAGNVSLEIKPHAKGWRFEYRDALNRRRHVIRKNIDDAKATARKLAAQLDTEQSHRVIPNHEWHQFQAWKAERTVTTMRLADAVTAFLEFRTARVVRSTRDLADLRSRLRKLTEAFPPTIAIDDITTANLVDHIASTGTLRTQRNHRNAIVRLWRYARTHKWVAINADRKTAAEEVPGITAPIREIGILTPEQMRIALDNVRECWRPFLALAGFAGIRSEELCANRSPEKSPLDWSDIDLAGETIRIRAATSKGRAGRPRIIPISPNLRDHLSVIHEGAGPVISKSPNNYNEFARLAKKIELPRWPHNGLRHSFGTYRMAVTRNAPQVAEEMGNGIPDIRKHYDRVADIDEGHAWFAV